MAFHLFVDRLLEIGHTQHVDSVVLVIELIKCKVRKLI